MRGSATTGRIRRRHPDRPPGAARLPLEKTSRIVFDPWFGFVEQATQDDAPAFYFEKGTAPGRSSRWAIFGVDPDERFRIRNPSEMGAFRAFLSSDRSPYAGVTVGYFGFDSTGLFEPLLRDGARNGSPFPRADFHHYAEVSRFNLAGTARQTRPAPHLPALTLGPASDTTSPTGFQRSVERLKEAIYDGEAFQVVLAHRRERPFSGSLLPMVDRLRRSERYAYLYYIRGGGTEVAGASPESVVEVHQGRVAVSPIAGTRPLPPPPKGPLARLPLKKDPKELAEHRMLVDLARNDVGRVSEVGSVHITRREARVPYTHLEHLVSRVVGKLSPDKTALDALEAAFPAGTVSGAPKIRATQLLRREEGTWRGPYAGAVGLLNGPLEAEFALVIRSAFASHGKVYTAAGAGIVHLSEPEREWRETLTKLASVEEALTGREGRSPGGSG